MWDNLKGFIRHYKTTLLKLLFALAVVFMVVQYNSYGKRSSAHYLHLQIRNGQISEICVAPSAQVYLDKKGTFAVADRQKVYIPPKWLNVAARDNLYLAIVFKGGNTAHAVYEIDDHNAALILGNGKVQGCRGYLHNKKQVVR